VRDRRAGDHEEKVYPMVPAGAASAEMIDVEWAEDDNAWVERASDPPSAAT
jgi:hypothetical protein